jgi:hypothetical protein
MLYLRSLYLRSFNRFILISLALLGLSVSSVNASIMEFNNQATFLAATGATSATGVLPDSGNVGSSVTLGSVTISLGPSATALFVGTAGTSAAPDWTPLNAGNDIAVSNVESINLDFAAGVFSAGFDFVEPTDNTCRAPCFDSTFGVTLKSGGSIVDTFTFNAPNQVLAFIGVWSDTLFDRMEIVDLTATIDDEYYGQFYTGNTQLSAVPIPAAVWLFGTALIGFVGMSRRRKVA